MNEIKVISAMDEVLDVVLKYAIEEMTNGSDVVIKDGFAGYNFDEETFEMISKIEKNVSDMRGIFLNYLYDNRE